MIFKILHYYLHEFVDAPLNFTSEANASLASPRLALLRPRQNEKGGLGWADSRSPEIMPEAYVLPRATADPTRA